MNKSKLIKVAVVALAALLAGYGVVLTDEQQEAIGCIFMECE